MNNITLPPTRSTPFGKIRTATVTASDKIPEESDVVIIGAGVNGLMAAWFLLRNGLSVTICEKGEVGGESSGRAFGWISGLLLDPSKMELSSQSLRLWGEIQQEIELGYRVGGLCYLASSEEEMTYYEGWQGSVRDSGYPGVSLLNPAGVAARFPSATKRWPGGIVGAQDGSIEPKLAAPEIAKALREKGVRIVQQCAVRGIEKSAGRVSGVYTEHGVVKTQTVIFAGNFWSRLFCGNLRINVPQLYAIMSMGSAANIVDGPVGNGGQEDWAWRRQIDGAYSLGTLRGQRVPVTRDSIRLFSKFVPMMKAEAANVHKTIGMDAWRDLMFPRRWRCDQETIFERVRVFDPPTDNRAPAGSLRLNSSNFSGYENAILEETWAGAITITPDNVPIASAVAELPGFYLITGCSYGLTWAPALGRMIAQLIMNETPQLDPEPYRLNRFFDGSPIVVKP